MRFQVAVLVEKSIFSTIYRPGFHDTPYRLIVPIAVRRTANGLTVVEPVWAQCDSPRASPVSAHYCAVYYPADIDAIIYLREWLDGQREVEVQCVRGDTAFCSALHAAARELWVGRHNGRWLGPQEVAAALPRVIRL